MKRCTFLLRLFLLGTIVMGFAVRSTFAQVYEITDFRVHVDVYQHYFDVKEDLEVNFHIPSHGIYRFIPLKYRLRDSILNAIVFDQWLGYPIYVSHINVPDYPDKVSRKDGKVKIRIGDKDKTVTGIKHYTISYRIKNAFLAYSDRSVFYWNLVGTEWDVPIDNVTYSISLYKPLELNTSDYEVITGTQGSVAHHATLSYHNGLFAGSATTPLKSGEGLTIQITFPGRYVQPLSSGERIWYLFRWFLLPLFLILVFVLIWMKIGRDRKMIKVVNYQPPGGIDPAMVGFLLNDRSDNIDVISLLPYWAASGLLEMEYKPKKHFWNSDEWIMIKKKNISDEAPAYEQTIFNGLFSTGNDVKLSSLKNTFYRTLNTAKVQLRKHALASGLYTPVSVRLFHYSQWMLLLIGFFLVTVLFKVGQPVAAIFTIIVTVILIILNRLLLKRSKKGDEVYQQIEGFKMFVNKAEKPKLEMLLKEDPAYFEKTLGYAVAFNLLGKWARHFDGLMQQPPSWYHGYSGASFRMNTFASQFEQGVTSMRMIMTSSPSGSGSGSGGGSSGGGFGGGGGGSW